MILTRILRGRAPLIGACFAALAAALQAGCGAPELANENENENEEDPVAAALALSGSGASCSGSGGIAPLRCAVAPSLVSPDILDNAAAIRLGKALFWDIQTGGDGKVACATCHYHGGSDSRTLNTVNPGPDGSFDVVSGPGQEIVAASFDADDRIGSQGLAQQIFTGISSNPNNAADVCVADPSGMFGAQRQVTGRNAPSTIGALFNRDNFWDGRANHRFNGLDPFGATGNASSFLIAQNDASLASQSVGPPGSGVEMSCAGRPFNGYNSLGEKLLARAPLRLQLVAPSDSVLGAASASPANGLRCGSGSCTYATLISYAFQPAVAANAKSQFSRIFGQAVQAYEATLIPDRTPTDRFLAGDTTALTASQQKGLGIFTSGKGSCTTCHSGPELSDATLGQYLRQGPINEDGGDQGFHNVGARPTAEDLGRAGNGPQVSFSVSQAAADRGAFKTPQLRNLKLTAPYFHNGDKATIGDVVDFYARGGDFDNPEKARRVQGFSLQSDQRAALVDFLTNGLTDCRVENEAAPFDHPSLVVPNGPALPAVGKAGLGPCP
jgi:cytochrome c peroxidase